LGLIYKRIKHAIFLKKISVFISLVESLTSFVRQGPMDK
jgi:hypothetical protein